MIPLRKGLDVDSDGGPEMDLLNEDLGRVFRRLLGVFQHPRVVKRVKEKLEKGLVAPFLIDLAGIPCQAGATGGKLAVHLVGYRVNRWGFQRAPGFLARRCEIIRHVC